MNQTIQLGQVQPSILSTIERIVKNWYLFLSQPNKFFSTIAGETFTNGQVLKAHAVLLFPVLTLIGIGGAL